MMPIACLMLAMTAGIDDPPPNSLENPFDANVKVAVTGDTWTVRSDGIPTHPTAVFPNKDNPNRILKQNYTFTIPRHPAKAEKPTATPFGPIGVALNGIPFYNPYNAQGRDAVLGPNAEVFDSCCGHPDPMGRYHYHQYPVCVKSPFVDPKGKHSPLLGYLFDGFALYGPNGTDGKPPADLNDCNGHEDAERGYHYHTTAAFPYLVAWYRGTPEPSNIDRPRFPGRNGPIVMEGRERDRERQRGGPPLHPLMKALDRDGDGILSADEIAGAVESLKALDRDGDGKLSERELRPPGAPPRP